MNRLSACFVLFLALAVSGCATRSITSREVLAAQQAWGEAIVAIGAAGAEGGNAEAAARRAITELYAYDLGPVLFKPTKAAERPFRPSFEDALSYFVGGAIAEDHGFALQPWSRVRFGDQRMFIDRDSAAAMGLYYFTDAASGAETPVEFTFGYRKDSRGRVRIFLHHSSLPYQPKE